MDDMKEFMERARAEFLEETMYLIEQCEESFLKLEDPTTRSKELDHIFRAAHTIKGSGGAVGYTDIMEFAHFMEDFLSLLRKDPEVLSTDIISVLLRCCDLLRERVVSLRTGYIGSWDVDEVLADIKFLQDQIEVPNRCGDVKADCNNCINGFAIFDEGSTSEVKLPDQKVLEASSRSLNETPINVNAVSNYVKIESGRVDAVLDLVGELVVIKSQLMNKTEVLSNNHELSSIVTLLDKTVRELQDKALNIRMTSMKPLFTKMQRMARDLSLKLGKEFDVIISGEDTEVDRTMVEVLGDPLMHLIRNAIDHGLESGSERERRGKSQRGKIHLSAAHIGERVIVRIKDDGRGISRDKVIRKAQENRLLDVNKSTENMTDREVYQLLFTPGFSTAEQVTDLSGRGVGLDVVKTQVDKIRGAVDVISVADQGTTFTISIPLTAAITDGMAVVVNGNPYIRPMDRIRELVKIERDATTSVKDGKEVLRVRGNLFPLLNTHKFVQNHRMSGSRSENSGSIAVVVEMEDRLYALRVDSVIGQMQVVTKPMGEGIKASPGIAGAAVLGDGRVALVFDIETIVHFANRAIPNTLDIHQAA